MCIGGELEHHKDLHSPSWKNRALECSACGQRVYIENCWSRFVDGTGTKGLSLVPVPSKNRDQWLWARSKAHWSWFVSGTGTQGSRLTGANAPRGPAGHLVA